MKISQQTISVIGVLIILGLFIAQGPIQDWQQHDFYENDYTQEQTKFTRINGEIDHAKKKLDSLTYKKQDLINGDYNLSGWLFNNIGIGELKKKGMYFPDTVKYLQLGNIGVDINEEIGNSFLFYYEKNGQGYLSRTKLIGNYQETTAVYDNGKLISSEGNKVVFIDKKVDYKYSYAQKSMIVPLNSKLKEVLATVLVYGFGIFQFVLFGMIIALFFRFLMFIARNNAFEEGNIQRLKYMSIMLFILAINNYVIYGVVYLIFISNYSSDGVIMNYSFWDRDYLSMIFAILCYLIYTAFKKAMTLQEESELTI
ncbi:MAG: DUF2975 domain-containing protein [Bacteroidota bacterium]